jgi:hypothetical protein
MLKNWCNVSGYRQYLRESVLAIAMPDTIESVCMDMDVPAIDRVRNAVGALLDSELTEDDERRAWLDNDENVDRFLRAEAGHEHKAAKRLVSMLSWMREEQPLAMYCPACYRFEPPRGHLTSSAAGHYMHVVTYDIYKRPTIYSCLELAANKDIEDNRKHLISTFETAVELMPPGVRQWNWVLDMHGFRLVDCDPRLARIFLSLASERYPERLGNFWVIDAPGLFSNLWSIIEKFIDPKTKEKIRFVKTKDEGKLRAALASHYTVDDIDFFVNEMTENRRVRRGDKTFCYREFVNRLLSVYAGSDGDARDVRMPNPPARMKWSNTFLQDIVYHTGGVIPPRIRACK